MSSAAITRLLCCFPGLPEPIPARALLLGAVLLASGVDVASAQERVLSPESISPVAAGVAARVHGPRFATSTATRGDSILEAHTIDLTEEVALIVQFQTAPYVILAGTAKAPQLVPASALATEIEGEHARFRADLTRILSASALAPRHQMSPVRVQGNPLQREFRHLLNGAAVRLPRWALGELPKLPYVKSIRPDRPVYPKDLESTILVRNIQKCNLPRLKHTMQKKADRRSQEPNPALHPPRHPTLRLCLPVYKPGSFPWHRSIWLRYLCKPKHNSWPPQPEL